MASDAQDRPHGFAWLKIGLTAFAALLIVLLAFAGWLLGSESGARTAFSALDALSAGALKTDGVHGRLAGSLKIDRLALDRAGQQLILKNMDLDWQPSALLNRQLHINMLRIGRLDIVSKMQQKSTPPILPDSLALPMTLQIDRVQLDGGAVGWGPVNLIELGAFAFNLDFDGTRYRLGVDRFDARSAAGANPVSGRFSGQATLSAVKPYALSAGISIDGAAIVQNRAVDTAGRIDISGSLTELAATIDLAVKQAQAQAQAKGRVVLRPFSEQPLGNANVAVQAIDLSALAPGLPRTQLDARLSSMENGSGELTVTNTAAGLYNETGLPLTGLRILFRQSAGQFNFDRIAVALGSAKRAAGTITGSGRYADGALTLALQTGQLDLQRLDRRLRATRLAGTVDIRNAAGRQDFTVALSEPLKKNKLTLSAHGMLADASLALDRAELRVGQGRIDASGHADLSGRQSFSATGRISRFRLQDLGNFAQLPSLDLNGDFSLRGTRMPQLEADLAFRIADSRLAGYPLQGDGRMQLRADRLSVPGLRLAAGANRLTMQGELSQRESRLSFALTAPNLEQFGSGFGGALNASGTARGSFNAPRINAEWKADRIRLPGQLQIDAAQGKADIGIDRSKPFLVNAAAIDITARNLKAGARQLAALSAHAQFAPQPGAPLALDIRAQGFSSGELRADSFNLTAGGTTSQHAIDAALAEPGQNWTLKASGGLRDLTRAAQWQGTIDRLDAAGPFTAHLAGPASLTVSQQRMRLDGFRIDADTGVIVVDQFIRDPRGITTRGRFERLQIAPLLKFAGPSPALTTDLQLDGEWNAGIAGTIDGSVKIKRRSGDIVMRGSTPIALGLRTLDAGVTAADGRLNLQLLADGAQLGRIDVDLAANTANGAGRFSIAPNAPLSGSVRIDIPTLGWAGPLMSAALITEGRLQSAISVGGTFAAPRLAGRISGSGLRFFSVDNGVDLRQGILESEFKDTELLIRNLRFQSGGGQLAIAGPIDLAGGKPAAQLSLNADRFALFDRSDRKLVVSGASRIALAEGSAKVNGAFRIDSGFFDIGRQGAPQLSDDVVIVGQTKKPGGRIAAAIDVSISLGDGVTLKGRGLYALLLGQIRLLSAAGEPLQAQGSVRVAKGTYSAYGRELAVEHGVLQFTGPVDNPALDILAMRRGTEVEAGVAVRGTVLAPRVTLVSEPSVPDAEKLSWLVLGHGLNAAGQADLGALQSAAGALLSEGAAAGVQSQIATAFGLDTLGISTSQDNLQQRIVTLGKQISSRLYVSYQQGLETATNTVLLRYTLSPRLTLEAEAGTRSVLSLFYNISFD
ncbi:MAG: hypothetical protein JWQ21_2107 [Herminiimonas sp.]|nr:hypothetical protein [Herminiimonas sp.]